MKHTFRILGEGRYETTLHGHYVTLERLDAHNVAWTVLHMNGEDETGVEATLSTAILAAGLRIEYAMAHPRAA